MRRFFADIGSAGGHRAMAKAVVPMRAFREKFGDLAGEAIGAKLQELVSQFLHEVATAPEKSDKPDKSDKSDRAEKTDRPDKKREPVRL